MIRSLTLSLAAGAWIAATASAQDLMPPHVMSRLGLTQAWARPVQVPVGSQSIANQQLFVHYENPREYVEIVVADAGAAKAAPAKAAPAGQTTPAPAEAAAPEGKVLVRIPTERIGAGGKPIGRKEAERIAGNEIRRLKRRGIAATINVRKVPRVHLYTLATDGVLECRDAETGEPIWVVRVGDRRLPFSAIGVNEQYLTIINGANLIKVEAASGEVMEEVRMSGAPMFGAINAGDFAMVPMIGGGVEGYPINDPTRDPFYEIVEGAALAMPTKAPGSSRTAWGTDSGFVYVMEMQGTPSVLFRLNTDGLVGGRIATASGDRFFFGSDAGQAYGLRATRSGTVLWSKPFGEPFYNEPMVVGDLVLLRSTYGNLFALNIEDGSMTWDRTVPNIDGMMAAFDGRLFVTTLSGAMAVIDLESGENIATFNDVRPNHYLVNTTTDRIYLVTESGDVQCLRPVASELPRITVQPDLTADEPKATAKPMQAPAAASDPFGAGGADPFGAGGGADPFGAAAPGGGADPFGGGAAAPAGGADPFGGGGDAAMDDPFGGNPFGN